MTNSLNNKNDIRDIIWYHGSLDTSIRTFNQTINWFTTDFSYAKKFSFNGCIYKCKLSPTKIFNVGNTDVSIYELYPLFKPFAFSTNTKVIIKQLNLDETQFRQELLNIAHEYNYKNDGYSMKLFSLIRSNYFANILKSAGYDAIETIEESSNRCIGILNPDKIDIIESILVEDSRTQLLSASRNAGSYKMFNPIYKNRFARKKLSKFVNQVKSYNQINMDQLFKKDILEVSIPVIGETANYDITFKWNGVITELANNIKSNQNKFEHKVVLQALINSFNKANVYVKCTCDDFKYRFKHWSIVNNWGADDTSQDPGPGKGLANPKNDKGKGCKHTLLCLNNLDWIIKVASCLKNYITYLDKNNHNLFMKIIFPKLYPSDLIDTIQKEEAKTDTEMDKLITAPDFIDVINNWAKNRGKFVKGSNKNPAASK